MHVLLGLAFQVHVPVETRPFAAQKMSAKGLARRRGLELHMDICAPRNVNYRS